MLSNFIRGESRGIEQLKRHEGCELAPYKCTAGVLTIGYGRNLEANGISQDEADLMLSNDIAKYKKAAKDNIRFFDDLNTARQWVLINMAYNMGIHGLLKFKKTLIYIELGEYRQAAEEMLNSAWAGQVGSRAGELARQMDTGKFQE